MRLITRIYLFLLAAPLLAVMSLDLAAQDHNQAGASPQTSPPASPATPAWVARSNDHAQLLLAVLARFTPEAAGELGVSGLDERIFDLTPGYQQRSKQALQEAIRTLQSRLAKERDPSVRQDLEILLQSAQLNVREIELKERTIVPYFNLTQTIFGGVRALLDDQVPAERRRAVLVRLRRYAGMEEGYTPITTLAARQMRERLARPGLLMPVRAEVERDLGNHSFFIEGIKQLCDRFQIAGYEEPYHRLTEQLAAHDAFIRSEVLPRARTDFRLPAELYAFNLEQVGVDLPPAQVATMAHAAFTEIQREMQEIAPRIARERGWKMSDYREVIRALKRDQIVGEAILPHYQQRLQEIEAIIRREHLVTLPTRPARIRLATPAESANVPAPNMRPPRLLGNKGEQGEFILPLRIPTAPGANPSATQQFDDFTFTAASWTLTAHEARPGHEMQFASVIERGVSTPRAIFAFNSVNVEGWGLYAEAIMKPFMPLAGQMICLQLRLMRAARAFLDPELHLGRVTREEALRVLKEDVVLSNAMATQEVERYTFRSPGQATSYFYGYTRFMELRRETERAMGRRFNQQQFHDFILGQGLLPPRLLRQSVMENFVRVGRR